jgi:lipopolysaccharide biosynthesis glycosyltransferase
MKRVAFCVVNSDYIDPCIVALTSFFRYNNIETIVFYESGTNIRVLKSALSEYPVEFRERDFPQLAEHEIIGDKYFNLFVSRESLPAFAMRLKALDELKSEYDVIVNFDIDTLFFNTIMPIVSKCSDRHIYGVSERMNRDRWVRSLGVSDIAPYPVYINTGFCVYGSEALKRVDIMSDYADFLRKNAQHVYCPEQDYLNVRFADVITEIPEHYNLMFTSQNYVNIAPVMVHYLGSDKPWSHYRSSDRYIASYFKRYLVECQRCSSWLSEEFIRNVTQKMQLL